MGAGLATRPADFQKTLGKILLAGEEKTIRLTEVSCAQKAIRKHNQVSAMTRSDTIDKLRTLIGWSK